MLLSSTSSYFNLIKDMKFRYLIQEYEITKSRACLSNNNIYDVGIVNIISFVL